MARRVNDKAIINLVRTPTSSANSTTIYNANNNAATVDRVIFTGSVTGTAAPGGTRDLGLLVVHHRPNDVVTGMSVANANQMWPDDKEVMFQALLKVSDAFDHASTPIHFDVRGMRKLAIGESIRFYDKVNSGADLRLNGCFTVFAKLA